MSDSATLMTEYEEIRPRLDRLKSQTVPEVNRLLEDAGIQLAIPVQSRVKEIDSILQKADRPGKTIESLDDVGDLVGFRIILLFLSDIGRVCDLISENFNVRHKEDAQNRLDSHQFGYGSIHFQATVPRGWLELPSWKGLGDIPVEIQVRTASQHIWATASHVLQYKREEHVPKPVLRAVSRVAALLELVDLELDRVVSDRQEYAEALDTRVTSEDEILNTETVRRVLDEELPGENFFQEEPYDKLLDELFSVDIATPRKLRALLREQRDHILATDKLAATGKLSEYKRVAMAPNNADRRARGVFFSHAGLVRTALDKVYGSH